MPFLIIENGALAGTKVELKPPKITFGRLDSCSVKLDDQNVSRLHAECMVFDNGIIALIDMGSSNGTYVNDLPISRIFLMDGDVIRMGETVFNFYESEHEKPTKTERLPKLESTKKYVISKPSKSNIMETFLMHTEGVSLDALKETYLKLRTLYKLLNDLAKCENLNEAFNAIGDGLLLSTPAKRIAFFLIEKFSNAPDLIKTCFPRDCSEKKFLEYPISKEAVNSIIKEKSPAMLFSEEDNIYDDEEQKNSGFKKSCWCMGSPILKEDNLIGLIIADIPDRENSFLKNDLDLLSAISKHLGEILTRLIEIEKLREKSISLERIIAGNLTIICKNKKMTKILENLNQIAESDSNVLIIGESGTGKELIAKAIHYFSNRRNKSMVCINSASLPETLLESELFGYEKGAFTGAITRKPGRFELANEGTVFLDEIGDISLTAQAKLLRIIQEGELERIGGTQTLHINVRLICATNKDIIKEIEKGNFRDDLYYRINVIKIEIPPLRERPEDIPALAEYFLKILRKRIPTPAIKFNEDVIKIFITYPWYGNVRELHNVVERALVFCKNEEILPEHLPVEILEGKSPLKSQKIESKIEGESPEPLSDLNDFSLTSMEKHHIQRVLALVNGNKQKAAKLLNISRSTLYEKLKEFDF